MTLLKSDKTIPIKQIENIGFSIKDGWNFGIGFGLAMTIAVPILLLSFGLVAGIIVLIFSWLGMLF
jgi:hypothetical protein